MHFEKPSAIITYVAGRHGGHKLNKGAFPSGQWGQTVNLLLNASVVRIHQLPPKRTRNLGCGFFFVLELVGIEQVGRPQAAKNSPADCFLDRGLRIHQLPPKSCGKNISATFFLWCTAQSRQRRCPIFKVRFYRDVQPLPGGWIFLLPTFSAVFRMLNFPAAGDRGAVHARPVKSETGHRIAAGTCNPGGKQV